MSRSDAGDRCPRPPTRPGSAAVASPGHVAVAGLVSLILGPASAPVSVRPLQDLRCPPGFLPGPPPSSFLPFSFPSPPAHTPSLGPWADPEHVWFRGTDPALGAGPRSSDQGLRVHSRVPEARVSGNWPVPWGAALPGSPVPAPELAAIFSPAASLSLSLAAAGLDEEGEGPGQVAGEGAPPAVQGGMGYWPLGARLSVLHLPSGPAAPLLPRLGHPGSPLPPSAPRPLPGVSRPRLALGAGVSARVAGGLGPLCGRPSPSGPGSISPGAGQGSARPCRPLVAASGSAGPISPQRVDPGQGGPWGPLSLPPRGPRLYVTQ